MQALARDNNRFDAVIVGSGATGGWAAKQLTEAGWKVALLDAGSKTTPDQFSEHVAPYQMKYRDTRPGGVASPEIARKRPLQATQGACSETNYRWYVDDAENPYTYPEDMPFHWIRVRAVGGRTLAWGRQSYRMSDLDFKAASHDGYGVDWPIAYADLAPYYAQVERFVGISGQAEGLETFPDGELLPPMAYTCAEKILKERVAKKFGRLVTVGRTAILTREHQGRAWHGPPRRPNGLFVPRFRNVKQPHANGMIRGYSYQGGGGPQLHMRAPGFGKRFKEAVRAEGDWSIGLHGFCECLPHRDNYAEIDPHKADAWGIPVLRVHMKWRDNEYRLFRDCLEQGAEMLEAAGAKDIETANEPRTPGFGIHEVGSARMGADPRTSIVDGFCQTHDVKNLFVTDGAVYPSMGTVNPTLTMMANTVRACDRMIERAKKGELG